MFKFLHHYYSRAKNIFPHYNFSWLTLTANYDDARKANFIAETNKTEMSCFPFLITIFVVLDAYYTCSDNGKSYPAIRSGCG